MPQKGRTLTERILAKKIGKSYVEPGEIITVQPDYVLSHDNSSAIIKNFKKIGVERVFDPEKIVIVLDHIVPAAAETHATGHKEIREFVKEQGIKHFYDINRGICHQVFVEEGFARPGYVILGSDSHTTTYGAMGAFSAGIGRSETAAIWATGEMWLRVPESFKFTLTGKFPKWTGAKDLALFILGKIGADGAIYKAIEFVGPLAEEMPVSDRLVLANLAAEMGAKNGIFYPNKAVKDFLAERGITNIEDFKPDPEAQYELELTFDVSNLEPLVAAPHSVDNIKTVKEVHGTKIHQVLIGTCTNGRIEDLAIAAEILKGKRVSKDVRTLIFPASYPIYLEALKKGYIQIFIEANAVVMNPGCGPCLGGHEGVLADGEVCLSTANRNFKGRMGCNTAEIYLSNPAVAAASAITGYITHPEEVSS